MQAGDCVYAAHCRADVAAVVFYAHMDYLCARHLDDCCGNCACGIQGHDALLIRQKDNKRGYTTTLIH